MDIKTLISAQKLMLFIAIVVLPLTVFPKAHLLSVIGNNLVVYPLMMGIILWVVESIKNNHFDVNHKYLRYVLIYVLWQLLCTAIGLVTYDYNKLLSLEEMDKLSRVLEFCNQYGIKMQEMFAIKLWLFLRFTKDVIKDAIVSLGTILWIIHLFRNKGAQGFQFVRKAVLVLTIIMCSYSIIEVGFLYGVPGAGDIIAKISPKIMDLGYAHGWWSPALWGGQLRSLCAEPSFFGILSAFIVPFLFSFILEKNNIGITLLYVSYVLMIFLSKARTATILFLSEMSLLLVAIVMFLHKYWNKALLVFLLGAIGFSLNIHGVDLACQYISSRISPPAPVSTTVLQPDTNEQTAEPTQTADQYVENNISSVVGDSRSNIARKADIYAHVKVGLEHPIFGTGHGLKDAYVNTQLPEWAYDNGEVRNWSRYMYIQGVLKSGFPSLNKYAVVFAEYGLIGLCLYIYLFIYIFYKVLKNKILKENIYPNCLLISFAGLIAAMFSNIEFMCLYIACGLLLCYVDSDRDS